MVSECFTWFLPNRSFNVAIWAIQKVTLTTDVRYDHFSLNTLGKQIVLKFMLLRGKLILS